MDAELAANAAAKIDEEVGEVKTVGKVINQWKILL
jgi:hypothetical protein